MASRRMARWAVAAAVAGLLAAGCGAAGHQQAGPVAEKRVIRVSIGLNEDSHEFRGLKRFKDEVEKNSRGRYEVRLYANAQLGDDLQAVKALQAGTLEMAVPSTSPLNGICKELGVFDLPFLFPDAEVAFRVLDGPVGQRILDSLPTQGLVGLAYWDNGFRHVTNSVREIRTPADVRGLKIRTMENPVHLATWRAMGADPTPLPFSLLFGAMQQKTVDGQENPVPTIYQQRFAAVQKYCTLTAHVYTPFVVLMSKKVWDGMSVEDQKIFEAAALVARDYQRKVSADMSRSQVTKLREAGMTVTELTPEQLKAFRDAAAPVSAEFAGEIGLDVVKAVQAEVAKYGKQ